MKLKKIIAELDNAVPQAFSDKNDNTGLQIGCLDAEIKKVLIALELTSDVLAYAIENSVNLIITHHPLFFNKLYKITAEDLRGRLVIDAIKNNIAVYAIHTNADAIIGGINDYLANILDLNIGKPLEYLDSVEYVKFVTFIPEEKASAIREELLNSGIGKIGNYSHCSFNIEGQGTFLPLEDTKPYIGKIGELTTTKEVRFETILFKKDVAKTINLLKTIHPYEEVAYDIYPLNNQEGKPGIGRYCKTKGSVEFGSILDTIGEKLDISFVRYNGDLKKKINKIALCTGSGGNFLFKLSNVDLIITADIKYHEAMDAISKEIAFIDIGHDQEKIFIPFLAEKITDMRPQLDLKVMSYNNTINPFKVRLYKGDTCE